MCVDKVLCKNIIATIVYYDVLDYPLTAFEIWRHLVRNSNDHSDAIWTLQDVHNALDAECVQKYIAEKNGMYVLCGRTHLIQSRQKREIISRKKIRKLRKVVSILRISPFVRMMCVTGRLSYMNGEETSDLDLLIAYDKGHIWTGRFFMTIITHACGVRRYGVYTNDRVCLNYHITTDALEVPTKDLFAAHEYAFMFPLFDARAYHEKFVRANSWITAYKPHYIVDDVRHVYTMRDNVLTTCVRGVLEWIFGDRGMENRLRRIQSKKIAHNPKTHQDGAMIIYTEHYLVFLSSPHGTRVFEE